MTKCIRLQTDQVTHKHRNWNTWEQDNEWHTTTTLKAAWLYLQFCFVGMCGLKRENADRLKSTTKHPRTLQKQDFICSNGNPHLATQSCKMNAFYKTCLLTVRVFTSFLYKKNETGISMCLRNKYVNLRKIYFLLLHLTSEDTIGKRAGASMRNL